MAFGFPAGVDPLALDNMSYSALGQAGMGFSNAFSNVAALGGAPGASLLGGELSSELGSATGSPNGSQALQMLMAQSILQNYQFLASVWQELGQPVPSLESLSSMALPNSPDQSAAPQA